MEHEVVGYGFADRGLGQITLGESLSLHCSEYKKTVNQAFGVAYANFFGMEERWAEQCARQHSDQEISVHQKSLPQSVDHGAVDQLPLSLKDERLVEFESQRTLGRDVRCYFAIRR